MMKSKTGAILLILFSFFGAFLTIRYFEGHIPEAEQKYLLDIELAKLEQKIPQEIEQDLTPNFSPLEEKEEAKPVGNAGVRSENIEEQNLPSERNIEKNLTPNPSPLEEKGEIQEVELVGNEYLLSETINENTIIEVPESYDRPVPFHPQSPFGTWGEIFGETCEEASLLLAYSYFAGPTYTASEFREELLRMVAYENEVFGDYKHTNVEQTAQILRDFYNYPHYQIIDNPSIEEMKFHLSAGSLILAPFYGVGLNPYYSGIGPEYHFMMIKGYTKDHFITHDVGTKRGQNYMYPVSTIMDRLHDYHPESIQLGEKKIIVVSPPA